MRWLAKSFGLTPKQRADDSDFKANCHKRSVKGDASVLKESISADTNSDAERFEPVKLERFNKYHRERADLHHHVTFKANKKNSNP